MSWDMSEPGKLPLLGNWHGVCLPAMDLRRDRNDSFLGHLIQSTGVRTHWAPVFNRDVYYVFIEPFQPFEDLVLGAFVACAQGRLAAWIAEYM